jgi:hypothetical protein
MNKFTNQLDNLKIASPCSANWDEMIGNERVKFCGECKLNVYNLSGMTKQDAENLLISSEGRVCVRMYKRADGSVITQDCPVGLAKIKERTKILVTAMASLIFTFLGAIGLQTVFSKSSNLGFKVPFVTPTPERLMGAIAAPTPKKKKTKPTPSPSPSPKILMGKPMIKAQNVEMGKIAIERN